MLGAGAAELLAAIRDSLQLNFGDAALGGALASLQGASSPLLAHRSRCALSAAQRRYHAAVKYFNARTGLLVLRCGRGEHAAVWASLTLLTQLRGRAAMFRLLHLAGTPQPAGQPRTRLAALRVVAAELC